MKNTHKILLLFLVVVLAMWVIGSHNDSHCDNEIFSSIQGDTDFQLPSDCVFKLTDEIEIVGDVKIIGNGSTLQSSGNHRIFLVQPNSSLYLENVTLTGVSIDNSSSNKPFEGGVIRNSSDLTMQNVVVSNNFVHFANGIGIYNSETGSLHIQDSIFRENKGIIGKGGGIYNSGDLRLENTDINNNAIVFIGEIEGKAPPKLGEGGGITNYGMIVISQSYIHHNRANNSGGIENFGDLQINHSTIEANEAVEVSQYGGAIGGIVNFGNARITDTQIINNIASGKSGIGNASSLFVGNSLISGNLTTKYHECSGLYNSPEWFEPVNAIVQNNYWGASTGPGGEGTGDGDGICGIKLSNYAPWLVDKPIYE